MPTQKSPSNPILSVSELNQYARGILEMHVGKVSVTGEISNFSQPSSGHWYFTLKDQQAQIRCALFRNKNQFLRIRPVNGMQIIISGSVSIYEGRGEYQLIGDFLEEAGIGNLQKKFEQLKAKLSAEGLFESVYKQKIPKELTHIAVITSATGAAIHDILSVLNERFPLLEVTLIPSSVQGANAAAEICNAIALAERWNSEEINSIDVIILGRGGGSIEDLWSFNEEIVARAIFDCKIPIISAVGHEVDTTIADYVADVRAPTPSAAAEMISPDQNTINQQLDYFEKHLHSKMENYLSQQKKQLLLLEKTLRHPGDRLASYRSQFTQLKNTLHKSQQLRLQQENHKLAILSQQFFQQKTTIIIDEHRKNIISLQEKLHYAMHRLIQLSKVNIAQQSQLLDTVSPLATLQRGYAIVRNDKNEIIRSLKQVTIGDTILTKLSDGELSSTITNVST